MTQYQAIAQINVVLDVETGKAFKSPCNEIRIPGDGGATFAVLARILLQILNGFTASGLALPSTCGIQLPDTLHYKP